MKRDGSFDYSFHLSLGGRGEDLDEFENQFPGSMRSALVHSYSVQAADTSKVWRIGFLTGGGNRFSFDEFRKGLRDLGYVEGSNIAIVYLSAEGNLERIPELVAELVQLKVDVLVTTSPGVRAAKQATKTVPIVMVTQEDPVTTGLVVSLGPPRWTSHRGDVAVPRFRQQTAGIAQGYRSKDIAHRSPLG